MKALAIPLPDWLRWVGVIMDVVSLAVWVWVQAALGSLWSAQLQLRDEHHLVTTGPYGSIRHPLYTAMMGMGIALALITANWIFAAFALIVIAGAVARVPREEQMMLDGFGDEYRQYMARTGRFLPRV